jgi:hypothetical protein
MSDNKLETPNADKKLRILTNVLKTALQVWLRSQVSQISQLKVEMKASDRQILSGYIPWVAIYASHAVYKNFHLRQIQLEAENIRINIASILKGQPLQLLETVPVTGKITVEQDDLNASLSSALLTSALNELLDTLLPEQRSSSQSIVWQKILLGDGQFTLYFSPSWPIDSPWIKICVGLKLLNNNELQITLLNNDENRPVAQESENRHTLSLGSEVDIKQLQLVPGKVICRGRINVNP